MLDGQRKIDLRKIEGGVERTYVFPAGYGPNGDGAVLSVRFRSAAIANAGFQAALTELVLRRPEVAEKRTNLRAMMDDADFMGVVFDHVILEIKTNLQVGGQDMEPTRENFTALMRYTGEWSDAANEAGLFAPDVAGIMVSVLADIFDFANFYMERKAALQKN